MSALTTDSLTIEAFEARMLLRRRMFARCGVSVAALHATRDLDDVARRTVETCLACAADKACAGWLDAAPSHTGAPVFCSNRRLIASLCNDSRFVADGS